MGVIHAAPQPGLIPILDPVLDLGAIDPPSFLQTQKPSPECANVNQGQLQCCRGTVAGDNQLVVWIAKIYGYKLNKNDVNGLDCKHGYLKPFASSRPLTILQGDNNLAECPGVKVCCKVTALVCRYALYDRFDKAHSNLFSSHPSCLSGVKTTEL
jgi:hypothetical protein